MRIEVNGTIYDVEHVGRKVYVNSKELMVNLIQDGIVVEGNTFYVDYMEDAEPSLMIINGMAYVVSKTFSGYEYEFAKEVKIPINGKITEVLAKAGTDVKKGDVLAILQAMKMEIQIKAPRNGRITTIRTSKDQSVKNGDVLITFE